MLHHAMWLSAFDEAQLPAALLCIPPQREGAFVDWEAQSVPSAIEYAEYWWWGMFTGGAEHLFDCFDRVLGSPVERMGRWARREGKKFPRALADEL